MDTNGLSQSLDSVNTAVSVAGEEEVRTLFVSGLPMDTKPRELYLLFRAYEGYEGSLLKVTSKNGKTASPVGFVTFSSRASAEAAKQDLQVGPHCRALTHCHYLTRGVNQFIGQLSLLCTSKICT